MPNNNQPIHKDQIPNNRPLDPKPDYEKGYVPLSPMPKPPPQPPPTIPTQPPTSPPGGQKK